MLARKIRKYVYILVASVLSIWFVVAMCISDMDKVLYQVTSPIWYFRQANTSESSEIACYDDHNTNKLVDILATDVCKDTSIFFIETSCHVGSGIYLTPRQACAVESAAKMNPDSQVYVLYPSPVIVNESAMSEHVLQLLSYPNVLVRHIDMERYFSATPLDAWYRAGTLRTSRWPRSHTSDVLRFVTLWKYGGIYLDLDVVVMKSLQGLGDFAGAESSEDVAAGVLGFRATGLGHMMAAECLQDLRTGFRGNVWGHNGPGVITRVLKKTCGVNDVKAMTLERCGGFKVLPPSAFYAIPWREWRLFFNERKSRETMAALAKSYAGHVWNKFSISTNVTVGSKQPYSLIAAAHCPRVYLHSGTIF